MGIKEIVGKFREGSEERKEMFRGLSDQRRVEKLIEEREKSANQRELERYLNEDREKKIKEELEVMRKKRDYEANFGHNPLGAENVVSKKSPQVLKTKNLFKGGGSMFSQPQKSVLKNNKNLFKSNNKLIKGGGKFI